MRENSWLLFTNKTDGEWQKEALNFLAIKANLMHDIREKSKHICLMQTFGLYDLFHCAPSFDIQNSLQMPIMIDELAAYLSDPRYKILLKFIFLFFDR